MTELPTLTKRKLQAQVIGPIYAEMAEQLGEQRAGEILDAAIKKAAIAEGKSFAAKAWIEHKEVKSCVERPHIDLMWVCGVLLQ